MHSIMPSSGRSLSLGYISWNQVTLLSCMPLRTATTSSSTSAARARCRVSDPLQERGKPGHSRSQRAFKTLPPTHQKKKKKTRENKGPRVRTRGKEAPSLAPADEGVPGRGVERVLVDASTGPRRSNQNPSDRAGGGGGLLRNAENRFESRSKGGGGGREKGGGGSIHDNTSLPVVGTVGFAKIVIII